MEERTNISPELEQDHDPPAPKAPDLLPVPARSPRKPRASGGRRGRRSAVPPKPSRSPARRSPSPTQRRNVMDTPRYADMDTEDRVQTLLLELGRMEHMGPDGRGGQSRILRLLAKSGTMPLRDLTEILGIQPCSASELVGKLDREGLVTRSRTRKNLRLVLLTLTEAGAARAAELERQFPEDVLLQPLTEQERATFLELLEKVYLGTRPNK